MNRTLKKPWKGNGVDGSGRSVGESVGNSDDRKRDGWYIEGSMFFFLGSKDKEVSGLNKLLQPT